MATPATHFGHCQLCGHEQKLPGGSLAKHGYAVEWSRFIGTCPGSGHDPIEVSYDLLGEAEARARYNADFLEEQAHKVVNQEEVFWVNEYKVVGTSRRKYGNVPVKGYEWCVYDAQTALDDDGYRNHAGEHVAFRRLGLYGSQRENCLALNEKRAKDLRNDAQAQRQYAAWLLARIEAWTPQPLREVEPEAVLPEVAFKVVYDPRGFGHPFKVTEGPDAFIGRRFVSERAAARAIAKSTGGSNS